MKKDTFKLSKTVPGDKSYIQTAQIIIARNRQNELTDLTNLGHVTTHDRKKERTLFKYVQKL